MKKIITMLLIFVLIMLSVFLVNGSTIITPEGYSFNLSIRDYGNNEKVYVINQYTGEEEVAIIPATYNNIDIKYIGENAFYKNSSVKVIKLNDNITQIENWGIRGCANLKAVYLPESLAVVWKYALGYNPNVKAFIMRNTKVETFYEGAFKNDTSLKYVSLPDTTKTISGICFENTALENIVIPEGTETISYSAFQNIPTLRKIYIPATVTTMGENIFYNSPNVKVYCEENSTAHKYCVDNSIYYVLIEKSHFPSNLIGDVDNSNFVDINDVTTMQKELAQIETEFIADNCDINGDCSFSIKDATYLQLSLADM